LEAQLEELLLVGLADDLDLIKLATTESFQNPLRMMLDQAEVSRGAPPPCWRASSTIAVEPSGPPG
jgi:hypothetical protein